MKKLLMQWHLTNKCNKRCSHCYQDEYLGEEFTLEELLKVGEDFLSLLREWNKVNNINEKGQINLTGGEPFIREDIWKVLDFIKKNNSELTFGILTNGSLLTEEIVKRLKDYSPKIVQISLDGGEEVHDKIRGEGSFKEVTKALKLLKKYNIKALVSFTANRGNIEEFREVVKVSRKYGAYKVWTDRMVPVSSENMVESLNNDETVKYINIIKREQKRLLNRVSKTKVSGERSLQFLNGNNPCYSCSAGDGLIILMPNGDVMPCRRLPIIAGNIKKSSLKDIYFNSLEFKKLRNLKIPKECEGCNFKRVCKGGARCMSYGFYGDYEKKDPGCPLK